MAQPIGPEENRTTEAASASTSVATWATALLGEALRLDRQGRIGEAGERYQAIIGTGASPAATLAEALRRMGVIHHRRNEPLVARDLCTRSFEIASALPDDRLAAEALNALAGFEMENGALERAGEIYGRAVALGGVSDEVRGRIEQNLGILANIQGKHEEALGHYGRALDACRRGGDERGCAYAYHNLGMVSADQKEWGKAEAYFRKSLHLAELLHDLRLRGLCLLNYAEVHLALQQYEHARRSAEEALGIFDELDTQLAKADAYKMLGMIFRETGRPALAESRLRTAIELAIATGALLSEAEATRELAILRQSMGRNQDALALLSTAHRLFGQLHAQVDLVDVAAKVEELETTYLAVVRDWGQSIESADSYTHGHCERVATYALAVAQELELDEVDRTTIRIGAYLHDLGKVKVPHEILNKAAPLTPAEFEVIKSHPVWGLELLAGIDLPWDIKPIIRSHHERYDGSGYPDGLQGDAIPLAAQLICVVDVYDALTTTRSYRPAMTKAEALATMEDCRHWWRPDVFGAFLRAV
ncbi:MAG: HD domain-containing phosphohydrolase [Gemmatimonadales bacterium]